LLPEYEQSWPLRDVFAVAGDPAPGVVTTHDDFAIAFTEREIVAKVELLLSTHTEEEARAHFRLCSQAQWSYRNAKRALASPAWKKKTLPILYRPFDIRYTINDPNVAVHRRERVLRHMIDGDNIALLTDRQVTAGFRHAFCSRVMANDCALSTASKERTYILPLYVVPEEGSLGVESDRRPNFGLRFLASLASALNASTSGAFGLPDAVTPEAIFHYIYAVLHSPAYRSRYAEFLKTDFPRIPLPGTTGLFQELGKFGASLAAVHLLEEGAATQSTRGLAEFVGQLSNEIETVDYDAQAVWLDNERSSGFKRVPADVWALRIGGYQVCEKWLRDRKGRTLSKEDVIHYQRIVGALAETMRIMKEIDEVIDQHGGWPGAFQAGEAACEEPPLRKVAEAPRHPYNDKGEK